MTQFYSEPSREHDAWALPDCEVFYANTGELHIDGMDDEPSEAGFYFWFCFPGCMPESEPYGPYPTEQAAIDAARDMCE